ncbi:hypothetical protein [Chitinophaga sp. Cy-1792]|uniref:hypothetical protein n=1 Tax=Chitinophaga sp. Cy-1792 TaxID=2608339 RepID=UPI001421C802|nr:hypothetical protein [Chitinophaga sp. Cy-1792]NIG54233.1 hypothetical protein [Chitinophaga sp. Cy-1792]
MHLLIYDKDKVFTKALARKYSTSHQVTVATTYYIVRDALIFASVTHVMVDVSCFDEISGRIFVTLLFQKGIAVLCYSEFTTPKQEELYKSLCATYCRKDITEIMHAFEVLV